ncbi:class I SAM-dependent methyltransferase [Deinococcus marmoris]|uniref:class I SAM-dependent methyltransferase n=1 Tax=Deinococcus marmoris TaxID=249408 RepID=UPI000496E3B7|nr:class I SAM-dependent methyltransferase [Deinococcus marmoris]
MGNDTPNEARQFWEDWYQKGAKPWTGRPNAILKQFAESLPTGTALDLGCSEGNSAVWLAQQGWQVTGADISSTALERAAGHAADAGVSERTHFGQHDLSQSFPAGQFDLVYALYLESPMHLSRAQVLKQAADAVASGGLLLIVTHASVLPWAWKQEEIVFPEPQEALDSIGLNLDGWNTDFLGAPERELTGPDGRAATVKDIIIALRRQP